MNDERRLILAGVLSLVVLLAWYRFLAPKQAPGGATPPPPSSSLPVTPPVSQAVSQGSEGRFDLTGELTTVESEQVSWEFSSSGGRLNKAFLKKYPPTDLVRSRQDDPLSLLCLGCNFSLPPDGNYRLVSRQDGEVRYEAPGAGVRVSKSYHFAPDSGYLFEVRYVIQNSSGQSMTGQVGLSWKGAQPPKTPAAFFGLLKKPEDRRKFVYRLESKVQHAGDGDLSGPISWAGIEERYFLMALVNRRVSSDSRLQMSSAGEEVRLTLLPGRVGIGPGGRHEETFTVYVGPKERDTMAQVGVGLEKSVDFGFFSFFATPILWLLVLFHSFVRNWGIAIILLTIIVKILLNPLSVKSLRQMKEMQKLQPKLAALKEKYKEDRQRLNMETMQIFKDHKVNPLGGCLPMLVQLPIYIALYNVLYNAIELYRAPFVWFYRDLSAPDPYFVLPALMGIFMVLQQKMTPATSADPVQRQMMMFMPVLFSVFMIFLPAGLTLYFFVNTVMTVIQQYLFQRDIRLASLVRRLRA